MKRIILLLILLFLFLVCTASPVWPSMLGKELLKKSDTDILCEIYGSIPTAELRVELKKRNVMTPKEWEFIDKRQIYIGMRLFALYASWGPPTKTNKSVGIWGTHIQHIYNSHPGHNSPIYVYIENGIITGWQY